MKSLESLRQILSLFFCYVIFYVCLQAIYYYVIDMPRKCCTLWDGKSCDSGQSKSDFKGTIFTFPSGKSDKRKFQRQQWFKPLPNFIDIETSTQHIGICDKHWLPGFEFEVVQGGIKKPINPPTEFRTTPLSFSQQSTSLINRDASNRGITVEQREISSAEARTKAL